MKHGSLKFLCILAFALSFNMLAEDVNGVCESCGAKRAASKASATLSVGANVNASKKAGYQAETCIVINPTNAQKMVVFSNGSASTNQIFRATSGDGGQTWSGGDIATGSDGLDAACCDPTACFDKFGTFFFCYLTSTATKNGVSVYSSTDSGATFAKVGATLAINCDQPTIVSGPGSTAGSSTVWVLYTDSAGNQVAQGMATTGLGVFGTFGAAVTIPSTNGLGFGDIAIGPAGQVVVAFQNTNSGEGPDTIKCSVKADSLGAGAFTTPVTLSATNVGGFDHITPQPTRSIDAEVGLAIDTTGGPFNGRTYAIYTDETPDESNNTDIMFRFSDNFGNTWSPAVKLNDDTTVFAQFFPKIALDKTTGAIAVAWLDCRNDPGSGAFDRDTKPNTDAMIYATVSADGGTTFAVNVKVSAGPTNALLQSDQGNQFGDYIGIAFHGGNFYPAWPDNSNSTGDNPNLTAEFDIYTAKVGVTINTAGVAATTVVAANAMAPFNSSAQTVALNATVNPTGIGIVNEGTVTFQIMSGASIVGTAATSGTVSNGAASAAGYALPAGLATGAYTIVATYNGSANFSTSSDSSHTLTVGASPPLITSPLTVSGTAGVVFSYTITASGTAPITFTASPLPAGLNFSGTTISGTPSAAGVTNVALTAANGASPNDAKTLVVTIAPAPMPVAPVFASAPTATPNPAALKQAIQFSAAATSAVALTYAWDFGDATSGSGAAPSHPYMTAGTFTATVTATDTSKQAVSATVKVTVNPLTTGVGVLPGEVDSHGNGYSDTVEAAAGNAIDFSIPPQKAKLTQTKLTVSKAKKLTLTGTLAIPAGFKADGQIVVADINQFTQKFQLDKMGNGKSGKDTFKLTVKSKKGVVAAQSAKFTLALNGVPDTVKDGVPLQIVIGNVIFTK